MLNPTDRTVKFLRGLFLAAFVVPMAWGYVVDKDSNGYVFAWDPGTITVQIKLPTSPTLMDGTNYATSVQAAMQSWNTVLGIVQFSSQITNTASPAPAGTYSNGNNVNEIVMDSKYAGSDFDATTLAITLSITHGNNRVEADTVFNTAFTWDSYRGGRVGQTQDIRRVAIHELGHVLGLDHPDTASPPQTVTAVMNSRVSYSPAIDTMQADDIAGAQLLYGAPGFVPPNDQFANATFITSNASTVQLTGTNVAASKETGEPAHAGANAPNGHSVWWKWTAPSSGSTTFTTLGSDFDTVLAVYTGSSVSSLGTAIASDDDVQSGVIRTSSVTFNAVGGTTYYIAVDGWGSTSQSDSYTYTGAITLNLNFGGSLPSGPVITTQPANETAPPGGSASFTVVASGNPTGYQWSFNGSPISGATSATYTLSNVQSANAGNYQVVVSNGAGSTTSSVATLTVLANSLPSGIVTTGHNIAFSAGSTSGIQWQVSTDGTTWTDLTNNGTYSGVNTGTLEISGATSALNGQRYRYVVSTTGGTSTSNAATLTVASAFFPFPVAVTVDSSGNLYVGDTSADTVQKISSSGAVTTLAGTSGQTGTADGSGTAARFNDPSGVIASADGTLNVSDNANATIRHITSAGVVSTLAGSTTARGNTDATGTAATFSSPVGIGQDSAGNLYVADATNNTIRKITSGGVVTTLAGSAGVTGSADGTGNAARFNHPTGIAVDGPGNIFVADSTNNTIRKISSSGAVTTLAGLAGVMGSTDGTGSGALFNNPGGLAVDSAGNVYVADTGNSIIRKITPAGAVTLIAGLPGVAGLEDGTGSGSWFNQPKDLTVDGSGNIFVADTGNAAIRKITPAGSVTTVALTQGTSGGTTTPTPTPTTPTPTPAPTTSSSGGGGGGAMNGWVAIGLGFLCLVRWRQKKH